MENKFYIWRKHLRKHYINGELPTCKLQYKRKIKKNNELTNTHLIEKNLNYCQQCKLMIHLADSRAYLQSSEHKNFGKCGTV